MEQASLALRRTPIHLPGAERSGLQALARGSGRSQSAMIRDSIDAFLGQHVPQGRLARLKRPAVWGLSCGRNSIANPWRIDGA